MGYMRISWLQNAYSRPLFSEGDFSPKISQTDLFLVRNQSLLVGLCAHDYKSLCAAVTVCATLVNTREHTHTHRQTTF